MIVPPFNSSHPNASFDGTIISGYDYYTELHEFPKFWGIDRSGELVVWAIDLWGIDRSPNKVHLRVDLNSIFKIIYHTSVSN
jgi:hypothetical protein